MSITNTQDKERLYKDNEFLIAFQKRDKQSMQRLILEGANPKACAHQAITWACYKQDLELAKELSQHYSTKELSKLLDEHLNSEEDKRVASLPIIESLQQLINHKKKEALKTHLAQLTDDSKLLEI